MGFGGSMGNMGNMLKQAQKMQANMARLKEELGQRVCSASAGGGAVSATVSCDFVVKEIKIDPELLKDADAEMLQDLCMTAVNQALKQAQDTASAEMSKLTGGFKLPF
jgi:DNA-binding YbaB/EbfC family protein